MVLFVGVQMIQLLWQSGKEPPVMWYFKRRRKQRLPSLLFASGLPEHPGEASKARPRQAHRSMMFSHHAGGQRQFALPWQ